MFSTIKTYLILILIVIILLLGGYGFIQYKAKLKAQNEAFNNLTELQVKTNLIATYKDKNNNLVTRTYEYEKSITELKASKDTIEQSFYRVLEASKLKQKQINHLTSIILSSNNGGNYTSVDTIIDTVYQTKEIIKYYNDGYLRVFVYTDSLEYTYTDSIIVITASRMIDRKFIVWRWINWKKTIDKDLIEVTSANPNSTTKNRIIKIKRY